MKNYSLILLLFFSLLLTACSGSSGGSASDSDAGKELFTQSVIGSQSGCTTCHSLGPDVVIIGPSLAGVGTRAATLVSGQSATDYLKEAITAPDAYITEGFPASIMPQGYSQELNEEQINQLVAYMLTLK